VLSLPSDRLEAIPALFDQPTRGKLREKIRPFDIGAHQLIEAFLGRLEDIRADGRGNARVVDQQIQPA